MISTYHDFRTLGALKEAVRRSLRGKGPLVRVFAKTKTNSKGQPYTRIPQGIVTLRSHNRTREGIYTKQRWHCAVKIVGSCIVAVYTSALVKRVPLYWPVYEKSGSLAIPNTHLVSCPPLPREAAAKIYQDIMSALTLSGKPCSLKHVATRVQTVSALPTEAELARICG